MYSHVLRWMVVVLIVLGVSDDLSAQAPLKNGMATTRERSYILTAKRMYRQFLSVEEARMIAQVEDKIAAGEKIKWDGKLSDEELSQLESAIASAQQMSGDKENAKANAKASARPRLLPWYLSVRESRRKKIEAQARAEAREREERDSASSIADEIALLRAQINGRPGITVVRQAKDSNNGK